MPNLYETQQRTAEILCERTLALDPKRDSLVHLQGAVGTGRTTVLDLTHAELQRRGKRSIFLPVEQSDFESGASLLAHLYDGIEADERSELSPESFLSPRVSWNEKFQQIRDHLNRHCDDYVLVCDEPFNWSKLDRSWQDRDTVTARQVSDWIFGETQCRRIVTDRVPEQYTRREIVRTQRVDDSHAFLRDSNQWSVAADLAESIANHLSDHSEYRAVMEVRLAVAFAWLFSPQEAAEELQSNSLAAGLVKSFLDKLQQIASTSDRHREFCRTLMRMTIGRGRWSDQMLLRTCPGLSTLDQSVLKNSLCEEWGDGSFRLHPFVRYEVIQRSRGRRDRALVDLWKIERSDRRLVHQTLLDQLDDQESKRSLTGDLEYLNHWAMCGDQDLVADDDRIHFVEQLHEIGASLSHRYSEHKRSIEVYRLALGFDINNARSHHYLAYNLDWIAEEEQSVERHYQIAIANDSQHPWYHSRWISYLITRGQQRQAEAAWREANDLLSPSEDSPNHIFFSLHRWVALWALHWGHPEMAENVLRLVKSELQGDPAFTRLYDLLTSMKLAEVGIAVFPLSISPKRWWDEGGHTALPYSMNSERLDWQPARIDDVADGKVYLSVGHRDSHAKIGMEVHEEEIPIAQILNCQIDFSREELLAGRFVELGYYGPLGLKAIGMHKSLELDDPDIPNLVPPPNRWYKRASDWYWETLDQPGS